MRLRSPDPSINKQKNLKKPWFLPLCNFVIYIVIFEDWCKCTYSKYQKLFFCWHLEIESHWRKAGSRSGKKWYGSTDPDPYKNITNQEHCNFDILIQIQCLQPRLNWSTRIRIRIPAHIHRLNIWLASISCMWSNLPYHTIPMYRIPPSCRKILAASYW